MGEPISIKLVVVGDGGVGKSSITTALLKRDFNDDWDPTVEDSYNTMITVDGQTYAVEIIDTAGQEEYRGLWGESTVMEGDGFILVYAIDSVSSYDQLADFLHIIRKVKSPYDDPTENRTPQNTPFPFSVLGNKCDLASTSRVVQTQDAIKFAKSAGGLFGEVSAKQRVNIDSAFASIVKKTAESKRAKEEWAARKGAKADGFNGNIAILEKLAEDAASGATHEEERPRHKPNPALAMDRNKTKSVGGLGRDKFGDDEKTGGCCTIC